MEPALVRAMSLDPSLRSALDTVFGKSDARTIRRIVTGRTEEVAKFGFTTAANRVAQPKNIAGAAAQPAKPKAPPAPPAPRIQAKKLAPVQPAKPKAPSDMAKADNGYDVELFTEISKIDTDKRLAFGWASIVSKDGRPVTDRQGDYIRPEDLEDSAYTYVLESRKGGHQHKRVGEEPMHVSDMIESVVLTPEKIEKMGLPPSTPVGWWVGYKVRDDDVWDSVKKGEVTGFSVHGRGRRIPLSEAEKRSLGLDVL